MAMTAQQRTEIIKDVQSEISSRRIEISITKSDFIAAIDAWDTFLDDNVVAINNALPAAAKAGLTTAVKNWLFAQVASKRSPLE